MKKYLSLICTALIVVLLALTFAGCNKEGDVKAAFKKAGYEVTYVNPEDCDEISGLISTYITNATAGEKAKQITKEEVIKKLKVYTCTNENRKAAFVKFPKAKDVELALGENVYKTKSSGGYVNENCYLLASCRIKGNSFFSSVNYDALYIFQNA